MITQTIHPDLCKTVAGNLYDLCKPAFDVVLNDTSVVLAGGFVRDTLSGAAPKDVDLWVRDAETEDRVHKALVPVTETFKQSPWATTYLSRWLPIQVIRWEFTTLSDLLRHFDFSVCQAAVCYADTWIGLASVEFFTDIQDHVIHYNTEQHKFLVASDVWHMTRLLSKGYRIPKSELIEVMSRFAATVQGRTIPTEGDVKRIEEVFEDAGYRRRVDHAEETISDLLREAA